MFNAFGKPTASLATDPSATWKLTADSAEIKLEGSDGSTTTYTAHKIGGVWY
jgi:hypothetical protein